MYVYYIYRYMCMYVCMYIYIHMYVYVHIYIYNLANPSGLQAGVAVLPDLAAMMERCGGCIRPLGSPELKRKGWKVS